MCGITGWVAFDRDLGSAGDGGDVQRTIDAMTATLSCRGPDDSGTWRRGHAALGHRRLAVIDLPGGRQPMVLETDDGPLVITYSGETYTFEALRSELRSRGHRFGTDSDTEVVLHGYLEWGDGVAERLTGMYAFAVWDGRRGRERLVLVRDRLGVKPLYVRRTADGVLYGSEPKAVLAHPDTPRRVTLDGLRELFAFTKAPGWALWEGLEEVLPGHVVTVDRDGLHDRAYWRLTAQEHTDDTPATVARVRELMTGIVSEQLVADVPRCVLLSGGLDSSAVTGLAAARLREQGERLRTFAVDFVGQEEHFVPDAMRATPDAPYVRDVARLVGSAHEDIVLDAETLSDPDVRRRVVTARDIPAGLGDMDASLFLLFKAIREHSTVALSGESADEVFGGYAWFHDEEAVSADTFPWMAAVRRMGGDRSGFLRQDLRDALDLPGYVDAQYRTALAEVDPLPGEDARTARMREVSHLHLTRFVRMLLDRKDRMSMAVGLEVRVPFCDHRLVEYVYNAPWALKTYDGREKSLLRAATRHALPDSVAERVKSPYPSTQDPRYAASLQQQVKGLLAEPDAEVFALVDRGALERALDADPAGLDQGGRQALEKALDLQTWIEEYQPELDLTGSD
ncbi:asparagine synthase (glutamine-hydrolyzing) [Lapillicoccus jejuensis]|uniref:asparagine synthase (glutamine-hydrolyzing) n=1 Tax=Lapillicoccus jejuensis TaxID=402171 RepID=A0A542DWW4_9MICO|nr:asparagine synthase (glutamine-hydrolyzing) [Lapillicoccus jejuensis]TQJ07566.1 asparagine synthase (glutamine-hydrolysing) [Lapillicoccus jejuensis]